MIYHSDKEWSFESFTLFLPLIPVLLLLGPGAAEHYQIQTGDTLTFTAHSGETDFKVSGIGGVDEIKTKS